MPFGRGGEIVAVRHSGLTFGAACHVNDAEAAGPSNCRTSSHYASEHRGSLTAAAMPTPNWMSWWIHGLEASTCVVGCGVDLADQSIVMEHGERVVPQRRLASGTNVSSLYSKSNSSSTLNPVVNESADGDTSTVLPYVSVFAFGSRRTRRRLLDLGENACIGRRAGDRVTALRRRAAGCGSPRARCSLCADWPVSADRLSGAGGSVRSGLVVLTRRDVRTTPARRHRGTTASAQSGGLDRHTGRRASLRS